MSSGPFLPLFPGASVWYASPLELLILDPTSDMYCVGILTCECDIYRYRCLHFSEYSVYVFERVFLTFYFLQAAQGVAASKDVLAELFDRIGCFFARLEIYTNVTPTKAMTGIITEILVEVLKIFGIATKELRRGSTSKFPIGCA